MKNSITMPEFVQMTKDNFADEQIQTIVEVGSLNGADSVYFKQHFPHARVIAFEGLRENWEAHTPEGVEWYNKVVTDHDGKVTFHVKKTNGIHGIYDRGVMYGTEKRTLDCYRLDSLITESIDMMKIDVEGATYDVLVGMGELLKTVKIMHIETEDMHFFAGQKLHNEVAELLVENNFRCLMITEARIQTGKQHDSVWANEKYLDS